MDIQANNLRDFFDRKVAAYNRPDFIESDPVSIPHRFNRLQDIEIAGFFAAIFSWGNRTTIIQKGTELIKRMDGSPYDFILHHREKDLKRLIGFKHRTFNTTDLLYFVQFLRVHYQKYPSLEIAFLNGIDNESPHVEAGLNGFYNYFFSIEDYPRRTQKHIASPEKNSGCKRLNMFLRWMVRKDKRGVDFGIWKQISPSQLVCPIDVHVARVAKRFNLLQRNQPNWLAALELTHHLRRFDPDDPVKYDYALFGLGIMEKF